MADGFCGDDDKRRASGPMGLPSPKFFAAALTFTGLALSGGDELVGVISFCGNSSFYFAVFGAVASSLDSGKLIAVMDSGFGHGKPIFLSFPVSPGKISGCGMVRQQKYGDMAAGESLSFPLFMEFTLVTGKFPYLSGDCGNGIYLAVRGVSAMACRLGGAARTLIAAVGFGTGKYRHHP